jgi:hypothetical protein
MSALFAGHSRLITQGLPLAITLILYAVIGLALLLLTRDKQVRAIIRMFRKQEK